MASVADKPVVASGVDAGDAARRRNVAAPQPAAAQPVETDDKKKAQKKVRTLAMMFVAVFCKCQLPISMGSPDIASLRQLATNS